jgi:NMD protein affecting ribosome stability and mRNA decay
MTEEPEQVVAKGNCSRCGRPIVSEGPLCPVCRFERRGRRL